MSYVVIWNPPINKGTHAQEFLSVEDAEAFARTVGGGWNVDPKVMTREEYDVFRQAHFTWDLIGLDSPRRA
jgi:hypothetical protein